VNIPTIIKLLIYKHLLEISFAEAIDDDEEIVNATVYISLQQNR
jgi:hypothetical protein